MEKIIPNWAFIHITEQIFGYLDISCLAKCLLVSKEWNSRLKKIFLVKCLKKALNVQFRVRDFDDEDRGQKISLVEMCPDWNETFTYLSHHENVDYTNFKKLSESWTFTFPMNSILELLVEQDKLPYI